MRAVDVINAKRRGKVLTDEEIKFMIDGYMDGSIAEYQMSAFLMAVVFKGMTIEETTKLTEVMRDSGDVLALDRIKGIKADKHSTGGVGDKTTIILAPMVAVCGVPVAKMSGRGLGHTGGTIDKLESIPGFRTALSEDEFVKNVNKLKLAITGQTGNLAPADKKIYALRDVTGTVESIPLIASSIMSKKLASGADAIVLDVKCGDGAFMKTVASAKKLAETMVQIGKGFGKEVTAVISDMNQPLGQGVGNAIEVIEAIEVLKGNGPKDLNEICYEIGARILVSGKVAKNVREGRKMMQNSIKDGSALKKFKEMIKAQGGDPKIVDDYSKLPTARIKKDLYLSDFGKKGSCFIKSIKCEEIGRTSMILGGGRAQKGDDIDLSVGVWLNKKVSDKVTDKEPIITIYANDESKLALAVENLKQCYKFTKAPVDKPKIIIDYID